MDLPKDLREINEEQFTKIFNLLSERTKNWTEITQKLLTENPQSLFVIRMVLCLSQSEFTKLLKVDKQWVRHFESGRQGFKKSKVIPKCVKLINNLLKRRVPDTDKVLEFLRINQDARNKNLIVFPERKIKFKRIFEMTEEDFKRQFRFMQNETKNFIKFEPDLIIKNPELFATFRVILDMSIPKFSKIVGKDSWRIRRWESFKERIMPESAKEVMSKIEHVFISKGLIGKPNLRNGLNNFTKFSFFEPDEINIMEVLNKFTIPFEIHANLNGSKRKLNLDFVIPNTNNPKIGIEVTRVFDRKFGDIQRRIFFLDHKFQLVKIAFPKLKTMMFLRCNEDKESAVNGIFNRDVINSDFCFVNDLSGLISKVSEVMKN